MKGERHDDAVARVEVHLEQHLGRRDLHLAQALGHDVGDEVGRPRVAAEEEDLAIPGRPLLPLKRADRVGHGRFGGSQQMLTGLEVAGVAGDVVAKAPTTLLDLLVGHCHDAAERHQAVEHSGAREVMAEDGANRVARSLGRTRVRVRHAVRLAVSGVEAVELRPLSDTLIVEGALEVDFMRAGTEVPCQVDLKGLLLAFGHGRLLGLSRSA